MADVVLLSFEDPTAPSASGCGACGIGGTGCPPSPCTRPSAAVLACRDALVADGASVDLVTVGEDTEIDAVLTRLDGPARPDGLRWPAPDGTRLVVASAVDGQLRAVLRRMVRRYAPPPSRRPTAMSAAGSVTPALSALMRASSQRLILPRKMSAITSGENFKG
ncbi:MAG TPA: hypothetical protein VJT31_16130, partial [Rugosimonospora sp.]|nr:hypothetical protein [Rugosimonospora sp.]